MENLAVYEDWLRAEGYQPSTIKVTLRHIKAVAANGGHRPLVYRIPHVRRYLRYVAEKRRNPLGKPFAKQMRKYGLEPAASIRKQGGRARECLIAVQWSELRGTLRRNSDDIDKMLIAYMHSPYRISEFLRLWSKDVTEEDVVDKRARDWLQSRRHNVRVYKILCDTERCAYYRMRTRLRRVCKELGLTADLDLLYKSYHELEAA